jgi:hypothetical protein
VTAGYLAGLVLFAKFLINIAWDAGWLAGTVAICGFPLLCVIAFLFRRQRTELVLDDEGIWLEDRGCKGIAWAQIAGYALPAPSRLAQFFALRTHPSLKVWDRDGETLEIPDVGNPQGSGIYGPVLRELDRRVGPDGDRPPMARDFDSLSGRLRHHDLVLPAVEMEPGVVYRYGHRKELRKALKDNLGTALPMTVSSGSLFFVNTKPELYPAIFLLNAVLLGFALPQLIHCALLWRSLRDCFVREGDTVWVLRGGRRRALPLPSPRTKGALLDQPLTAYGRGPFAYRMAPQFLEPDV